jgi:hypothetical protein
MRRPEVPLGYEDASTSTSGVRSNIVLPSNPSSGADAKPAREADADKKLITTINNVNNPAKTTGLRRAPLSGGVKTATDRWALPSPQVAVRNLVEQVRPIRGPLISARGSCTPVPALRRVRVHVLGLRTSVCAGGGAHLLVLGAWHTCLNRGLLAPQDAACGLHCSHPLVAMRLSTCDGRVGGAHNQHAQSQHWRLNRTVRFAPAIPQDSRHRHQWYQPRTAMVTGGRVVIEVGTVTSCGSMKPAIPAHEGGSDTCTMSM